MGSAAASSSDRQQPLVPRAEPPDVAYHYTDGRGLLGILTSHRVEASNLRYMNDFSELAYAERLVRDVLAEKREETPALASLDPAAADVIDAGVDAYCFSLSVDGDAISQWREYGARGTGYAVGFEARRLAELARERDLLFMPVVYDPREQRRMLSAAVDAACEGLAEDAPPRDVARALARALRGLVCAFKDPVFAVEEEWRVVQLRAERDMEGLEFRATRGAIVPFVRLDVAAEGRLPLARVVQGPTLEAAIAKRSLALLLRRHGYEGAVEIAPSKAPLRF